MRSKPRFDLAICSPELNGVIFRHELPSSAISPQMKTGSAFLMVGERGEDIEGVFHRGGVGVVAIVYYGK